MRLFEELSGSVFLTTQSKHLLRQREMTEGLRGERQKTEGENNIICDVIYSLHR